MSIQTVKLKQNKPPLNHNRVVRPKKKTKPGLLNQQVMLINPKVESSIKQKMVDNKLFNEENRMKYMLGDRRKESDDVENNELEHSQLINRLEREKRK